MNRFLNRLTAFLLVGSLLTTGIGNRYRDGVNARGIGNPYPYPDIPFPQYLMESQALAETGEVFLRSTLHRKGMAHLQLLTASISALHVIRGNGELNGSGVNKQRRLFILEGLMRKLFSLALNSTSFEPLFSKAKAAYQSALDTSTLERLEAFQRNIDLLIDEINKWTKEPHLSGNDIEGVSALPEERDANLQRQNDGLLTSSERLKLIFGLYLEGKSNSEIARTLRLSSEDGAKSYLQILKRKIGGKRGALINPRNRMLLKDQADLKSLAKVVSVENQVQLAFKIKALIDELPASVKISFVAAVQKYPTAKILELTGRANVAQRVLLSRIIAKINKDAKIVELSGIYLSRAMIFELYNRSLFPILSDSRFGSKGSA